LFLLGLASCDPELTDNPLEYALLSKSEKIRKVIDSLSQYTETTFAKDIIEIFAVSGNAPNNRLVEFLGFDDLNKRMQIKGVSPIRISHRLSTDNANNVTTKPLVLYLNDSTTISSKQIINRPPEPLQLNNTTKGVGFYAENHLYKEPFDFALKNYYPIKSQHALLKRIMFPENFPKKEQFNINKEQLQFLRNALLVNKDGVFNDDNYEYEEIGIPFLAQLGRELYDYELMRKRK